MRKFLALALVVVMMLALIPTAFAATTYNSAVTSTITFPAAKTASNISWATDQDLGKITNWDIVDNGNTLKIVAKYADLKLRGNDYVPYVDIPLAVLFPLEAFNYGTPTGNPGTLSITMEGVTQDLQVRFATATGLSENAINQDVKVRFFFKAGGNDAYINVSYKDDNTNYNSSFWSNFTASGTSAFATKKILYVDAKTAVTGGNAIVPVLIGNNANNAKATWDPDTDDVRIFANFDGIVNQDLMYGYGKELEKTTTDGIFTKGYYFDLKTTLMQADGTAYPANTPVHVEQGFASSISVNIGESLYKLNRGTDYQMYIVWENDRENYLAKDGSLTIRIMFRDDKYSNPVYKDTANANAKTMKDLLKRMVDHVIAKPQVYVRNVVTGVYTEKTFNIRMNNSYYIPQQSVQIVGGDFTMKVGETKALSTIWGDANTLDKNLTWASSDATVASVTGTTVAAASAVVTAKKAGVTVINARSTFKSFPEAFVVCTVVDDTVVAPDATTVPYVVVCNALNKRVGAGTSFGKSAPTLKRGEVVDVIEVVGGWAKYEIGGKTFYSSLGDGKYLQPK